MPKPLKLRKVNEIVGFFIILSAALVIAAILLGPRTQRWFTPSQKISIHLPAAGSLGLRRGADVLILGSVVGSVDDIIVTDAGEMEAAVSIRGNFIRFVRNDSMAIIRKPLGIGDASIEITRGFGAAMPSNAASLESMADKAPTEMVQETLAAFRGEALPAIKEARGAIAEYAKLATELRGQQAGVHDLLEHANRLAAAVEQGQGLAAMLLSDPKPPAELRAALPKINASLDELQAALADTRKVTDRLSDTTAILTPQMKRLPEIADNLDVFVKNMRTTSEDVRKTAAKLPELEKSARQAIDSVPTLILQVEETSRQIQRLTEAVQRNWLVRGYMDQAPPQTRIDPNRVGSNR